jgi:Nuclease A inhibitor-like protein
MVVNWHNITILLTFNSKFIEIIFGYLTQKPLKGNKKHKRNFTNLLKVSENEQNSGKSLVEILTTDVAGLLYPSESDEKIRVIDWQADNPAPFDTLLFRKYIGVIPSVRVEVLPWEKFFESIVTEKEWWTDFEKERAAKFLKVKETIAGNLTNLEFLRAGNRVEIEAYLIGQDIEGKWKGLKTLIIES